MPSAAEDADLQRFVSARWPVLVRTLVLLGCPAALASDVVATGLGRCRRGWLRTLEQDDPDVVVTRAVLAAWAQRRRGPWWTSLQASEGDLPGPDLSELDRMPPDVRAAVVLRLYTGLDRGQAQAVAGRAAGDDLPPSPDVAGLLRAAADDVPVLAPPDVQELDRARSPRHRGGRAVLMVAAVVALGLGLAAWTVIADEPVEPGVQDEANGLEPAEPTWVRNPAEVAWYADDVLHLAKGTYAVPGLRDVAIVTPGVAYGDAEGRVVHLADNGTRTLLGTKDPAAPLVVSSDLGWISWVDPVGPNPRLLVYSVGRDEIIGELDLPASRSGPGEQPDTHPVAIEREAVYFVTAEGAGAWRTTRDKGHVDRIQPPRLLDVVAQTTLSQIGEDVLAIAEPLEPRPTTIPGRGGELSEDAGLVLTRDPSSGDVVVYDVVEDRFVDVRPPGDLAVADAVLAPARAITYFALDPEGFATREGSDSHPLQAQLVTCQVDDGTCAVLASVVVDSEAPVLGR